MMRLLIDTDAGNCAIRNGNIERILQETLKRLKPEAAYFYPDDGMRAGFLIFQLNDASEIPSITETLFQELGAKIWFTPAMSLEDLQKGLQARQQEAA